DRAAAEKRAAELRFDGSLVVKDLSRWDRAELRHLLGVDPVRVRPAPPKPPTVDIRKPLEQQTQAQVNDVLDGKRSPRPGTTQPELSALVLHLLPSPTRAAEVRRFVEQRKPARPGTLQAFIVLRNLN